MPTFAEMGYPDLVATVWFSLSGPANLPGGDRERLNAEVRRALELPEVRERLKPEGIEPARWAPRSSPPSSPRSCKRWGPVVQGFRARRTIRANIRASPTRNTRGATKRSAR